MAFSLDRVERQTRVPPPEITTHRHQHVACSSVALSVHCGLDQAVSQPEHVAGIGQVVRVLALDGIAFKIKTRRGAIAALKERSGVSGIDASGRG
jgi:hypothetical protein